ncbi:DUF4136 domain-containing protein [Hydrogenophaga sp. PAMC20947]|uniref:DUF4136 domain-containing protein n=1 Tax=Hydrogenophaga sp. PAMC20947 TaxID=2565558 RepID=UPI00109DD325|nr:DUF4136 domain-containing protein [Hydrogenophaga sp. PAMC20947]QCB46991.1 DUF4136 domain-containing protein [Hydrogenophaga sp. PAMC20947]
MSETQRPPRFRHRYLPVLALGIGLTGCAGVYRVDNRVESFARWSETASPSEPGAPAAIPGPPQTYRFERLPSQATGPATNAQAELESFVQTALAPLGWTPAAETANAPWTVQVSADHQRLPRAPWEDPWEGGRFGWSTRVNIGVGSGQIMWSPWLLRPDMPYHLRRVSLVIRDARQGQVVFETSAAHDGRWNSTPALWNAMISAALKDFPAPPTGVRDIPIDVPR